MKTLTRSLCFYLDEFKFSAILDTGADTSIISREIVEKLQADIIPTPHITFNSPFDDNVKPLGSVLLTLTNNYDNSHIQHKFFIIENNYKNIFGLDLMSKLGISIFCDGNQINILKNNSSIRNLEPLWTISYDNNFSQIIDDKNISNNNKYVRNNLI